MSSISMTDFAEHLQSSYPPNFLETVRKLLLGNLYYIPVP